MAIDYNRGSEEEYVTRLRSYENKPMSFEESKEELKDWIKFVEDTCEQELSVSDDLNKVLAKQAVNISIYNEIKKIMLISLYGFDVFIATVKTIKHFNPVTLLDEIEQKLTK
jgi:hypothetical protein